MSRMATVEDRRDWRARTRESRWGTLLVLVVTAILVMVGAYLVERPKASAGVTPVKLSNAGSAPKTNHTPPDFTATSVDGKPVSLSSLKGHPVWLTFGASWCSACQAEAPDIEAAYERAKPAGVVVVAVFISEDAATVSDYGKRIGLQFTQVADPNTTIASAYRVLGIPAHFFIDKTGVLRSVRTGSMSPERMDKALAAISE